MKEESKYPCTECEEEKECEQQERHISCYAWRKWFHMRWEEIKSIFGKGSDDK
jgi:DNA-directed RNA polymerase subunit RPC12/RpoP